MGLFSESSLHTIYLNCFKYFLIIKGLAFRVIFSHISNLPATSLILPHLYANFLIVCHSHYYLHMHYTIRMSSMKFYSLLFSFSFLLLLENSNCMTEVGSTHSCIIRKKTIFSHISLTWHVQFVYEMHSICRQRLVYSWNYCSFTSAFLHLIAIVIND